MESLVCLLSVLTIFERGLNLENGLVRTPPMGWMSWTKYLCQTDCINHPFSCIDENLYMAMADRMVKDGYRDVGYKYVHIDDCWMEMQRDNETARLVADRGRFPRGIKLLSKYMHDRELKLAIYEDYGNWTCGGYPGSNGFLKIDAQTFAHWDVDYLKLDGCWIDEDKFSIGYPEMSGHLQSNERPIVYSCSWPAYLIDKPSQVNYTEIAKYCNLWRNYLDIEMNWRKIEKIINYYDANQDKLIAAHGPGHWNDPDMIVVGNNELSLDQSRSQMSLWAIWSAPLIMSNDLRLIAPVYRDILQNRKVIQVDQDPMGVMGRRVFDAANTTNIYVYVKPVMPVDTSSRNPYSYAVVLHNRNDKFPITGSVELTKMGLNAIQGYRVEELWTGQDLGMMFPGDSYTAKIGPLGASMIKAILATTSIDNASNTAFFTKTTTTTTTTTTTRNPTNKAPKNFRSSFFAFIYPLIFSSVYLLANGYRMFELICKY